MDLEKTSWFAGAARAAKCEVKNVLFHPWEVFACVVMPVVWCVLIAGLLNQGLMRELPFGLVDEDRTAKPGHPGRPHLFRLKNKN